MPRGKMLYPRCPAGLDMAEWRKFLDLIEHHKQRATINRATAGQPARGIQPPLGSRPNSMAG